MALERLTKDNFVDHPPFFPVYDYWYNELVDAFNAMVPTPGIVSGISAIYGGDSGIVNVEGVGLYDGMVEATNIRTFMVTIGVDQIVGNAANALNHANGAPLYSPSSTTVVEFVSAVLVYDFGVAAYTGGGNDTVIRVGATAVTGAITSASLLGAAADAIVMISPLATAGVALVEAADLNLYSGTAWTQPNTAAGVIRAFVTIRIHETGL
jgi:hypothetical protein